MTEKFTDISGALIAIYGHNPQFNKEFIVKETPQTYPIKEELWENWFPFAFLAFKKLAEKEGSRIKSFAVIGTGPGADAIGALCAFKNLESIIVTDINEKVVQVAKQNVERYASSKKVEVIALCGNLCQPLQESGHKVDVIYGNLPNIPEAGLINGGYRTASRFDPANVIDKKNISKVSDSMRQRTKDYLLESQLAFLMSARESLNEGGSVIPSIGGRVPYELLKDLAEGAGYKFSELIAGFKKQTEPWEVIPGYAEAERCGIKFDFYRYDDAVRYLSSKGIKEPFTNLRGDILKIMLHPYVISAKEAFEMYKQEKNFNIGHTVHMIRAQKQ